MINWIDTAPYYDLLCKWRFAKPGDPFFVGEVGQYYSKVISEKRNQNPEEHVAASKHMGWEKTSLILEEVDGLEKSKKMQA
jgi:zona occludens toxin (predicted ATPase)